MDAEDYALQQALISAAVVRFVLQFAKFAAQPLLTAADWVSFLRLLFPEVQRRREQSAMLARDFYDIARRQAHPELPVLARELEPYEFSWFAQALEPVRASMSVEAAPQQVVGQVAAVVVREVENAGRRQIINAVKNDKPLDDKLTERRERVKLTDEQIAEFRDLLNPTAEVTSWAGSKVTVDRKVELAVTEVRGWARVATGKETCAFCLALVSRGPVYYTGQSAGVDLPDDELVDKFRSSSLEEYFGDIEEFMAPEDRFHTKCDCKIVPVFDLENWVGRRASQRAFTLWEEASRRAEDALEAEPDKKFYSRNGPKYGPNKGKPGWYKTTLNREALNQLRQMIAAGEANATDWAALNAA